MANQTTQLRALHDLARQLAESNTSQEQAARALDALRSDAPTTPAAVLIWSERGDVSHYNCSDNSQHPAAKDVTPDLQAMQEHCLVCAGVVHSSRLLQGNGLPHWEGYALAVVRSNDGIFGVIGRRAALDPVNREFVCAVGAMLGSAIGMTRQRHRAVKEERQRRRVSRYLSPQVSARLADEDFASICCGERVKAAVLFSDICGFTKLSESLEPSRVVWMLNRYFSEMTNVVFQHGGMVDKFLGDGLMAVFGVPEPMTAPADAAVSCARDMFVALERLGLEFREEGLPRLETGIGVHFGEAIFGAVGDGDYSDLTLIGPAVNLASRVESATRSMDCRALLTRELLDACLVPPKIVAVGSVPLKGYGGTRMLFRPEWG